MKPSYLLLALAACVQGNPDSLANDGNLGTPLNGGTITPPGCGYTVTSRLGAEPPLLADDHVGADPTVRQVHLGLASDPRTSMVITWRTADDDTRAGKVVYGTGGTPTTDAASITFMYRTARGGQGDQPVRIHEVHLCGLTADTAYTYRVESDPAHTSATYTFRTAPDIGADPDAEVIIASVGDSRDGYEVWAELIGELIERTPDLVMFSGDAVTFGLIQDEWDEFFTAAEPLFATVPVLSVHGNHDVNAINFYSQFGMPGNEENFSFDYGHAHITVANDTPSQLGDLTGSIKEFLRSDLMTHQAARWKIVNHHRPLYSASANHGGDLTLLTEWGPVFDQYHVDVVLAGHDHDYERTHPMRANAQQPTPADGTVYIVSGGAGADLYDNGTGFWTAYSQKTHSALTVRVRNTLLEAIAFDESGAQIDTVMITKP